MAPLQYCVKKLDSHPWTNWIKLCVTNEQDSLAVYALVALMQELYSVTQLEHSEVAQTKIQWWHQQIDLFYQQQATHPVLLALQQTKINSLPQQAFDNLLEGYWFQIHTNEFDMHNLSLYLQKTYGSVLWLIGHIIDKHERMSPSDLKQLGQFVGLSMLIQNLGYQVRYEQILFPTDLLAQQDLNLQALSTPKENTDKLNKVLATFVQNTKSAQPHIVGAPFFNMLNQYYAALIRQIEPASMSVLQQKTQLAPLYTYWLLFKAIHQSKKRQK